MSDWINIPKNVHIMLNSLHAAGYEAYIVGGCVRDCLMGYKPKDWDITTSAKPDQVKAIFRKTYDTGIAHGTVSVRLGEDVYEVTTYRVDGKYSDFRRPDEVSFTTSLREDLKRRDFTINAMAYDPKIGLIDYFQGKQDLSEGRVRCVGDARERFQEDALRMLRALRFAAKLDFSIEAKTYEAMEEKAPLLANISQERICDELTKLLLSDNPWRMRDVVETGLMAYCIPEFVPCASMPQRHPYHIFTVAEHTYASMQAVEADRILRWTMFLHDIGKPPTHSEDENGCDHFYGHVKQSVAMADTILRRLRFDNASREKILTLIAYHDCELPDTELSMRKLLNKIGIPLCPDLWKVQVADMRAQNPTLLEERLEKAEATMELYQRVRNQNPCVCLEDLAVNGWDLIAMGYPPGKAVGLVLRQLLEVVIECPELNQRGILLETAEKLKKKPEIQIYLG